MTTKKAKTLTDEQISKALDCVEKLSCDNRRDRLWIMLSCFLGLRAQEIAYLNVDDVIDAEGNVLGALQVTKRAAKNGRERQLIMPAPLRDEVAQYVYDLRLTSGPMFRNRRRGLVLPNTVANQIRAIYLRCGFKGASSHSGRRTLITRMARLANQHGCSLLDVQHIAGHANLATTMEYIDLSPSQSSLLSGVWSTGLNEALNRSSITKKPFVQADPWAGHAGRRALLAKANPKRSLPSD